MFEKKKPKKDGESIYDQIRREAREKREKAEKEEETRRLQIARLTGAGVVQL